MRDVAPIPVLVFMLLAAVSVALPLAMANHHFFGDDWPVLAYPASFDALTAMAQFAWNLHRPMEGVFWVIEYKLFGFDRTAFHVVSLLLNAAACALFALALLRAFPRWPRVAAAAAVVAFFLPMLTTTTFVVYTDNSRLSVLLFWLAVVLYQGWARTGGTGRLVVAASVLFLAMMTYENIVIQSLAAPLFVIPTLARRTGMAGGTVRALAAILAGTGRPLVLSIGSVLAAFFAVRYLIFGGAVHSVVHPLPSPEAWWGYLATLGRFLVFPVTDWQVAPEAWLAGAAVALAVAAILAGRGDRADTRGADEGSSPAVIAAWSSPVHVAVAALVMTVFGIIPYALVFEPPEIPTLLIAGRVYSSAAYGVAMLLCLTLVLPLPWKRAAAMALVMMVGVDATFLVGIRHRWERAADLSCRLWADLLGKVPAVADRSTFLFIGMSTTYQGATIVGGTTDIAYFIPLLYDRPVFKPEATVNGYELFPADPRLGPQSDRPLRVGRDGVMVRGRNPTLPIDRERLILVERRDTGVEIVDRIAADDGRIAAAWRDGVTEVRTNRTLILPSAPDASSPEARLARLAFRCR